MAAKTKCPVLLPAPVLMTTIADTWSRQLLIPSKDNKADTWITRQLSANVDNLSRSSTLVDSSRSTTPLADASQVSQHERSASETMRLVNLAIQEAEKHMQESVKNSQLDSNIAPSLTVDLSRKNIEILPDDIVGVLKQSVERYDAVLACLV